MYQSLVFDDLNRPDVFFFGGIQVDRRGNLNLFGIPDGDGGWKHARARRRSRWRR